MLPAIRRDRSTPTLGKGDVTLIVSRSGGRLAPRTRTLGGAGMAAMPVGIGGLNRKPSELVLRDRTGRPLNKVGTLPDTSDFGRQGSPASEDPDHERPPAVKPLKQIDPTQVLGMKAIQLSKKHRLDFHEVKNVLQQLEKVEKNPSGAVGRSEFGRFLNNVFEASDLPEELVNGAFTVSSKGETEPMNLDGFLAWYMQHMFSQVAQLRGDKDVAKSNALVKELCKIHDISGTAIDKVKKLYDRFDLDKSGAIEYDEFVLMVAELFGAKEGDISKDRLRRSWKEIDMDGSGEVDFAEFVTWYVKYFGKDGLSGGATEAFYSSFNPSQQRQNFLDKAAEPE
ncbi:unnamed protein product [Polarella glacialis]|uniref:EF-hand domain-containing protein n=1 Tax=Polarella glacialis TaxID=89957 RepID=A0A813DG64_POLGL|nr:unnamed protein product [Polarella glacialis]CAE8648756.1 unnamed protein product [Polarella glacialis]|mmetsp:Transcript_38791/g.70438  ORF Transcript_38791/g.70438 Transcript_38791/m.70438 type:complete len:339 (+) Transcript_38791:57-1073(+)